ncbi:MAG: hypothetical protein R3F07_12285 [Opitutaceae bacterium]
MPRILVSLLMLGLAIQTYRVTRQLTFYARDRISPWTITVDLEADRNGLAKLYWDRGQGIREVDSAGATVIGKAGVRTLRFPVPHDAFRSVRFDPLRSEGLVRIHRLELRSGSGRLLYPVDLAGVRAGNQIASLTMEDGVLVARFTDGARDPYLFLGAMAPTSGAAAGRIPWLGLTGIAAMVAGLFALRPYTGEWVDRLRRLRILPPAWVRCIERIDQPCRLSWVLGAILVGLVQACLLYPLHHAMDLPLWDEARTMAKGAAFLAGGGLGNPPDSPLASFIYAGWVSLFSRIGAIFAAHYAIKIALAVVVFLFAARTASSILAGLSLAAVWVISDFQLGHPILTYQAALFWFLLGLLTLKRFPIIAIGCVALAALTRLEYQFALVAVVAVVVVERVRRGCARSGGRAWPTWLGAGMAWGLVGFVLLHLDGWNWGANRGWFAVEQHYALHLQQEGEFPGNNPFLDYPLVTERDFPGAQSLGQAARVNPGALANHVWWNLQRVPAAYLGLWRPKGAGVSGSGLAILICLLVTLPGWVVLIRSPQASGRRALEILRENRSTVVAILSGALVIAPGVIVYAKESYLLPVLPLGLAVIGTLHRLGETQPSARWNRRASVLAVVIGITGLVISPRPFVAGTERCPVRETLEILEAALPSKTPATLLGVSSGSYADLLGPDRVKAVEPLTTHGGNAVNTGELKLGHLLAVHRPDLILIDRNWRMSPYFDAAGAAALEDQGWTAIPVPDGILLKRP